jgi:hypothetical protein
MKNCSKYLHVVDHATSCGDGVEHVKVDKRAVVAKDDGTFVMGYLVS